MAVAFAFVQVAVFLGAAFTVSEWITHGPVRGWTPPGEGPDRSGFHPGSEPADSDARRANADLAAAAADWGHGPRGR